MLHAYDRATFAWILTSDLNLALRGLLAARIGALTEELIDYTEFVAIEPGDTQNDLIASIGLSPLIEPIDGHRWGRAGFWAHWDILLDHGGVWEMVFTYGSTHACYLFVPDIEGVDPNLIALCRQYATRTG